MHRLKKILFISSFIGTNYSGGSSASERNLELSKKIFIEFSVDAVGFSYKQEPLFRNNINYLPSHKSGFVTLYNYVFGNAGGLNFSNISELKKLLLINNYEFVFLDGSLLGKFTKYVKKKYPSKKIICFFHNVEKEFFKKSLCEKPFNLLLYKSVLYNEKLSAKYADYILCFNERDAKHIQQDYGKPVSGIFPVTVKDELYKTNNEEECSNGLSSYTLLFIGSDFYANISGLRWFLKKVMPFVNASLVIIGNNLEKYKREFETEKVKVIGTVKSVKKFYQAANAVVAPVFTGSGMKIKIAEALMMGKTIFGTTEAWQGYNIMKNEEGVICNNAGEFISAINEYAFNCKTFFNENARKLYEQFYTARALEKNIETLRKKLELI